MAATSARRGSVRLSHWIRQQARATQKLRNLLRWLSAWRHRREATLRVVRLSLTRCDSPRPISAPLAALMGAALALPGLHNTSRAAAEDEIGLQYGHFQEGARDIQGLRSKYDPIAVETLRNQVGLTLSDRLRLDFTFTQDTWSGATPMATAPGEAHGNHTQAPDGITGASPYLSPGRTVYMDQSNLRLLKTDGSGNLLGGYDDSIVHTLSGASPETRKQFEFKLGSDWDEGSLTLGGGLSQENDYESRFGSAGIRLDFNQKLTTLSITGNYARSTTSAILDHDAISYIYDACTFLCDATGSDGHYLLVPVGDFYTNRLLTGKRADWGLRLGVSQVLNQGALIEAGVGFSRSSGYLGNPYKVVQVLFIDPEQQAFAPAGTYSVSFNSLMERRPGERQQGTLDLRYVQNIAATQAAVHLGYRYFQDDWGIRAHTFDADWAQPLGAGWTLTPRVRYYSQEAADFYTHYMVTFQGQTPSVVDPVKGQVFVDSSDPDNSPLYYDDPTLAVPDGFNPNTGNPVVDANGNAVSQAIADTLSPKTTTMDRSKLPRHYSSDHRLSAFGALSFGLTLSKQFARGAVLELGYERYRHAGSLKAGGDGEGSFSDFRYYTLSASVRLDLATLTHLGSGGDSAAGAEGSHAAAHADHHGQGAPHAAHAPAGIQFDHVLPKAGDFMLGYRYMYGHQTGGMRHGRQGVDDARVKAAGCEVDGCRIAPAEMNMHMHMLELMYAPTHWLTLMLMPQYLDMNMQSRGLLQQADLGGLSSDQNALYMHHIMHPHTTGGVGDTVMAALFRLSGNHAAGMHLGLGFSAPTGDGGVRLRDTHGVDSGFVHYGMQLGSGTWDFLPSLTYFDSTGTWQWGAQASATYRMEDENKSGFAFGDVTQVTAWTGYAFTPALSASVRALHTRQKAISGRYNDTFIPMGPGDYPSNYGGRFLDLGLGLNLTPRTGPLQGQRFAIEWLRPVRDDVNGYQLARSATLHASWALSF